VCDFMQSDMGGLEGGGPASCYLASAAIEP
jgi:hypothetical protein